MSIKRIGMAVGGAALVFATGAGAAHAASGWTYFDSASVWGCSANRYESAAPGQYTYYTVTGWGDTNITCGFAISQTENKVTNTYPYPRFTSASSPLYDGSGYSDQVCVTAYDTSRDVSKVACDSAY